MKLANSVNITNDKIIIDGVPLPFYVSPDIEVIPGNRQQLAEIRIGLIVDGTVTLDNAGGRKVYDRELGDVGEWARAFVRAGLLEAHPWLNLPAETPELLTWDGRTVQKGTTL